MTYAIRYQPEAEQDIEKAVIWHEKERRGLGSAFIDDLEDAETILLDRPQSLRKVHGPLRRRLFSRFKYGIYYLVEETDRVVQVIGVFHHRQDPVKWQRRYDDWLDA